MCNILINKMSNKATCVDAIIFIVTLKRTPELNNQTTQQKFTNFRKLKKQIKLEDNQKKSKIVLKEYSRGKKRLTLELQTAIKAA